MPPSPYKSVWPSHGVKAALVCELLCPNVDAHPTTAVRLHMAALPSTQWGETQGAL